MFYQYQGPGARRDIPAAVAGAELQRIYETNGTLTPSAVVEESRPVSAPLHAVFEWDDTIAAEEHRKSQARQLVRAVVLAPDPRKGEATPPVRAFVSVSMPDAPTQRTYKPVVEALQNQQDAAAVKARLLKELLALRQRYVDLMDFDEQIAQQFTRLMEAAA